MPVKNVTTAGTRVTLASAKTLGSRLTIQRRSANTGTIFVGIPGIGNTGAAVSSSAYDCYLDASNPSVTVGLGETKGNSIDASLVYIDAGTNGDGVAWFVEPI